VTERDLTELANGMGRSGADLEVLGNLELQHTPHRLDLVAG